MRDEEKEKADKVEEMVRQTIFCMIYTLNVNKEIERDSITSIYVFTSCTKTESRATTALCLVWATNYCTMYIPISPNY